MTGTIPANGANGVAVNTNLVVNFSEPVSAAVGAFTIACSGTGSHAYTVAESNPSSVFTLNPDENFSAVDVCTVTVDNAAIEDADSSDPPGNMAADYVFSFSIPVIDTAPTVTGAFPTNGATSVDPAANLTVTFNEDVTTAPGWYTLECPAGNNVASSWSGTGGTRTIDPTGTLPGATTCTATVIAALVTDLDGTAHPLAANYPWSFTTNACFSTATPIASVQGAGASSPLTGQNVTVEGVVSGDFQNTGQLGGFFIQSATPDSDPLSSEGIFVYNTTFAVNPGDYVRLTGTVVEYMGGGNYGHMNHHTQLDPLTALQVCATGQSLIPVVVNLPLAPTADPAVFLERYESMLVTIPDTLTVQQNYFQGRFGQVTLGAGGRVMNHLNGTGETFLQNLRRMIVLDDGSTRQNTAAIAYYPADGALRAGDTVSGLTGVLDQGEINSNSVPAVAFPDVYYRLHPTSAPVFNTQARPAAAPDVGGALKVASFNVLNYFTTYGSRGAENEKEFIRQHQKLVNAVCGLDADVIGLIEIENNGMTAVNRLLNGFTAGLTVYDGLNDVAGCGPYNVIGDPPSGYGADQIKVTIIYRPAVVETVGGSVSTNAGPFNQYRHPVAQTFREIASAHMFSVVVNHFKSKSCTGAPPTGGDANLGVDGGCYNATRVAMATALLSWIQSTLVPVDPDVLVIGDLNAYGGEDPIDTLVSGGLVDQVAALIPPGARYSYVFDGTAGYLDHGLSTADLNPQITGVNYWHINANEPSIIEYIDDYKVGGNPTGSTPDLWLPHAYRSSDHDPLLIGLSLNAAPVAAAQSITATEDTAYIGTLAATDIDGDPITFAKASDPAYGAVTVLSDGSFTYTPAANYFGPDSFTFTASDALTDGAPATVTITVSAVNDPPVNAVSLTDQLVTGLFKFSFNLPAYAFTDVDSTSITLSAALSSGSPLDAWLVFNPATGQFRGTPPLGFEGTYTIRVTASDSSGGTAFADFDLVIVQPVQTFLPLIQR